MTAGATFWARRRAGVRAETEAEAQAVGAARQAELAAKDDAAVLEELNLPDPDQLGPGDDFMAFMARDVPQRLRNKALRKLWVSNPVLACVDGLNDYDDDFRTGMGAGAPIKTAYQVGKGMMAHIEELARQKEALTEDPEGLPVAAAEPEDAPLQEPAAPATVETAAPVALAEADTAQASNIPRRMRFRFDEEAT